MVVFLVGCLFDLVLLWFGVACLFLVVCGAGGVWVWIWIFLFVCGVLVEGVFGDCGCLPILVTVVLVLCCLVC